MRTIPSASTRAGRRPVHQPVHGRRGRRHRPARARGRSRRRRRRRRRLAAPGRRRGGPPVRGAGHGLRRRTPRRRLRRGCRARRCAPPTTASSASPARSPARCTSPSPTPAGCAPRPRSWPTCRCAPVRRWRAATSSAPPAAPAPTTTTTGLSCTSGCGWATATSTRCCSSGPPTSPGSCTSSRPTSPTSPRGHRRRSGATSQSSLRLPAPGAGDAGASPYTDDDGCDTDLPLIGAAVDAACDVGGWLGEHAGSAVDAGIDFLDSTTDLAADALDDLRAAAHESVSRDAVARPTPPPACSRGHPPDRSRSTSSASGDASSHAVDAECSDAPAADGTGGSAHRVMVVAGINSSGAAWDRGPTVDARRRRARVPRRRGRGPLLLLRRRRRPLHHRRHPPADRRVGRAPRDAAAADATRATRAARSTWSRTRRAAWWSTCSSPDYYRAGDRTFPPLGNVVTLSSPARGRAVRDGRPSRCGRTRRAGPCSTRVEGVLPLPPTSSAAVRDLAEGSSVDPRGPGAGRTRALRLHHDRRHRRLRRAGHQHLASRSHRDGRRGRRPQRAQRDRACARRARGGARRARRATTTVRRVLTALRTAVNPVLISRFEHTAGDDADFVLRGGLRLAP